MTGLAGARIGPPGRSGVDDPAVRAKGKVIASCAHFPPAILVPAIHHDTIS
jgi:hypothetical protein